MSRHQCLISRLLLCVPVFLLAACSRQEPQNTDLVTFPLHGVVVQVDTAHMRIMIDHEEIPDYMAAMTMPFRVKDSTLLLKVAEGDSVQATLAVSRAESWLETVDVLRAGAVPPRTLSAGDIEFARLFKEGELFPDETLKDQEGKEIRFSGFRGTVLAVTFIYTRCPLPDFCIRMSNHFARIQKSLTADGPPDGTWHLLSISFDPAFDSPAVLKRYGETYGADFSKWSFAVGDKKTTMRIADGLGLTIADDEGGLIAHNLRTFLIDKTGHLVKVITGNEWKPEEVAAMVRDLARQ